MAENLIELIKYKLPNIPQHPSQNIQKVIPAGKWIKILEQPNQIMNLHGKDYINLELLGEKINPRIERKWDRNYNIYTSSLIINRVGRGYLARKCVLDIRKWLSSIIIQKYSR